MEKPLFQIKKKRETAKHGQFVVEPLEKGFGNTLGTALRRVLLTSLYGAAITQVKISGIKHQFSTLDGLREDVIEFILNLKQVRVSYEGDKAVKLNLQAEGPGEVKAGDIKTPAGVKIVNKDHVLGHLADKKKHLRAEIWVERGLGYSPSEERKVGKVGLIPIDASFGPVMKVSYRVEDTRVGRRTDLDRLILDIRTDGTIKPSKALKKSAEILVAYFQQIVSPKKAPKKKEKKEKVSSEYMELTVEELELPTRIANALRRGGYPNLGKLTAASKEDLARVKNLGEKSIKVIEAALAKKDASLKG